MDFNEGFRDKINTRIDNADQAFELILSVVNPTDTHALLLANISDRLGIITELLAKEWE